ncbi:MAG: tetratricopeptide repeat protein [Chloroflexi bacterium]|nr:tetratricopeptide repeat protein [Chloroflexota bacterium]
MADIALRAYVKEIDDLVEREQLDEAIAHSRHVLETYPKHLDTYRLLGKAYLEAKRYGDAADLFQRVLSAIPDDFVAHIGMSIVREDEGNLDASIWHMERAFETNPANPAIQQELRRLIGKRDGLEPHKVRLTRGALARMYAHGELYPQAIAELRSALQEDPDRPDLQVLLANLYWRTDQKEQAAEVAQQILTKLPFCRDANRIAAGYLQGIGRADEATPSHRRLASLDPYAAFVETAMVDPIGVDAGSVHLQKLEWRPGHPVSAPDLPRPTWTDSLGAGLRADSQAAATPAAPEGPIPSWLAGGTPGHAPAPSPVPPPVPAAPPPAEVTPVEEPAPASVHPFAGANAPPSAKIPPWMREAGWGESKGEAVEGPVSFSDDELARAPTGASEGELAPAAIPDWLKDIAPPQLGAAGGGPSVTSRPDWGDEAASGTPKPTSAPQPAQPSAEAGTDKGGEVPTWLEEPSPGATETIVTWLGDRSARAAAFQQPPSPSPEPEPAPEAEQPDWLAQGGFLDEGPAEEVPSAPEGPPAWLTGVAEAAASEELLSEEPPSWVSEETPEPAEEEITPEPPPGPEAPDWLRAIAEPGAVTAPSAEAEAAFGTAGAGIDWLRGIGEQEEAPAPTEAPSAGAGDEWLRGLVEFGAEATSEQPTPAADEDAAWPEGEPAAAEAAPSETPDWLGRLAAAAPPPETPSAVQQPSWLEEVASEGEPEAAQEPDWLSEMPGASKSQPSQIPEPEADDWLKGLLDGAALPQEPAPAPAEAGGEPDWFALQGREEESDEDAAARIRTATTGWLREVGEQPIPPDALEPPPAPDWLKEFEAAGGQAAQPSDRTVGRIRGQGAGARPGGTRPPIGAMDASAAGELGEDDVQKWLEALASRQEGGSGAAIEEAPPSDTGSFFPPAVPAEEARLSEEAEEGMDWLEQAAEQAEPRREPSVTSWQPVDQEPESPREQQPVSLESEEEEVPDWLRSLAAEGGPVEPAEEQAPAEETGPDWLLTAASSTVVSRTSIQVPEPPAPPEPPEPAEELEEEAPDWLRAPAEEVGTAVEPEPVAEAPGELEQAPDWLRVPAEEAGTAMEPQPAAERPGESEQARDWLLSAAGEVEPVEPTPAYEEEEAGMPDWLRKAAEAPEAAEPAEPVWEAPEAPKPVPPAALEPTWMRPSEPAGVRPVPSESEIVVPEWLRVPVEAPKLERKPEPEAMPEPVVPAPVAPPPVAPAPPAPVAVVTPPRPEAPKPAVEAPAPPRPPKARTTARTLQETLAVARHALASNDLQSAAKHYGILIRRRSLLDDVMADLKVAVERLPDSPELWQALGDAYMKADRAAEAVEAYRHGLANL